MINNKFKTALGIILLLVIAGGVFWYYKHYPIKNESNTVVSHEFDGNIKEINNSLITVAGGFVSTDHPDAVKDIKTATVSIDANTKITKVIVHLPTPDQLKQTNGQFNGKDLKRDSSTADLDTLINDFKNNQYGVSVYATATNNIYGKSSFTASQIKYEIAQ